MGWSWKIESQIIRYSLQFVLNMFSAITFPAETSSILQLRDPPWLEVSETCPQRSATHLGYCTRGAQQL